jgi:site-specific recombinase XerD
MDLPAIKTRGKKVVRTHFVPPVHASLIEDFKDHFKILIEGKQLTDPVFTPENETTIIHRAYLDTRINKALSVVSASFRKNIRSHSFRINFATSLIETSGIEITSKIIGHQDIRTTEMYNRSHLKEQVALDTINKSFQGNIDKHIARQLNTNKKKLDRFLVREKAKNKQRGRPSNTIKED